MALRDVDLSGPIGGTKPCKAGVWIDSLEPDDLATFTGWVGAKLSYERMAAAVRDDGHDIGDSSIRKHLIGSCTCPKDSTLKGARRVAQAG